MGEAVKQAEMLLSTHDISSMSMIGGNLPANKPGGPMVCMCFSSVVFFLRWMNLLGMLLELLTDWIFL